MKLCFFLIPEECVRHPDLKKMKDGPVFNSKRCLEYKVHNLSNLASLCEGEVLDLPIEVVESQPRMNLVIVIQSEGDLHDGCVTWEMENTGVRYMGTRPATRLTHSM